MTGSVIAGRLELSNKTISSAWKTDGQKLKPAVLTDRLAGTNYPLDGEAFSIALDGDKVIKASDLTIVGEPRVEELRGDPKASSLSSQLPGRQISLTLQDADQNLQVQWRLIGRDGSNYLRQEITLQVLKTELPVRQIVMIDWPFPDARVVGTAKGSPVTAGNVFLGFEHPMSKSTFADGRVRCVLDRQVHLSTGQTLVCSSVVGVSHPDQMRRDFLAYLETERAHPYRTFLHYNSWYDLGYFTQFNEAESLNAINTFGTELVQKRGATMDSFLFDDGWDDRNSLWSFHSGFPNGFTPLTEAATKIGASPGVWMSPWGGYGQPHDMRVAYGKAQGFETNTQGYILSGPKYYERFHQVCLDMINKYHVNQFKFDGTGNASSRFSGSRFGSDFEAVIQLIEDLRVEKRDLFINLTTGTWPSPFWVRYADSIWRGGSDHSFVQGAGSFRQRWISYRDAQTFRNVVTAGPLYPLNSLMLHGLIYAQHAQNLGTDPSDDFTAEVRSYFGTGTQLQEMYITPALLSAHNWDVLAEAAKWSRANQATLKDTHWVGGDPAKREVYGWAAWSAAKGILTLRNPSDQPATISIDVAKAFELPVGAPTKFSAHSPWTDQRESPAVDLQGGTAHEFQLKAFEVLTLEALPAK